LHLEMGSALVVASFLTLHSPSSVQAERPTLSLNGDSRVVVELGSTWTDPGANCADVEDGTISVTLPALDTSYTGPRWLVYTCTDSSASTATQYRHVLVSDTALPTLTLLGPNPLGLAQGSLWTEPGVQCSDAARGISWTGPPQLVVDTYYETENHRSATNNVDTSRPGAHYVHYFCKDPAGNLATAIRTVNVADATPPTLTLRGLNVETLRIGETWNEPLAECIDAEDGPLPVQASGQVLTAEAQAAGHYHLSYSCKDAVGKMASATRVARVAFAARAWRVVPLGTVATDWKLKGVAFYEDLACTQRIMVLPKRAGRRWPNGNSFSSPHGTTARSGDAFADWHPSGRTNLGHGWRSGQRCDAAGGLHCDVGFVFEKPTLVNCATFEQDTAAGMFAEGLRLQWRDGNDPGVGIWHDIVRIERGLTGGAVQLSRKCPGSCLNCGSCTLTVHPCSGCP